MKQYLLYFFLVITSQITFSQSLTPTLFSITGNSNTVSGYSVTYSLGELSVTTINNKGYFLTQGFLQGNYVKGPVISDSIQIIIVSPNPVYKYLNIDFRISNANKFNVEIININGSRIKLEKYSQVLYGDRHSIDMEPLPKGLYFIRIFSDSGNVSQAFKVERM